MKQLFRSMATAATTAASSPAAQSLRSTLTAVPIRYPFLFGVVVSGCKTSFSDYLVQKVVERREQIDWRRNAAFACFGFFYLGGVQYTLYVPIFGRLFPRAAAFATQPLAQKLRDTSGMLAVLAQTLIDQAIHHPFLYFPVFYCTKELVMARGDNKPDFRRCLEEYRRNMKEDLQALWKIWVPATIINFSFSTLGSNSVCGVFLAFLFAILSSHTQTLVYITHHTHSAHALAHSVCREREFTVDVHLVGHARW